MYFNPFDVRTIELCLEERVREAQACHARDRRVREQLSQALNWVGNWLIAWSHRLQAQQSSLELQGE